MPVPAATEAPAPTEAPAAPAPTEAPKSFWPETDAEKEADDDTVNQIHPGYPTQF